MTLGFLVSAPRCTHLCKRFSWAPNRLQRCVFFMSLTIQQARELINDPDLSDDEVSEALQACEDLSELLFETWLAKLADSKN